ncbi:MAG: MBOAT family protein [Lachnospiraceae bacterium]|nr:MBOAT family protein [Lachnospiraceae bacterium]
MSFVSITYGVFLIAGMIVYYCIPKKGQWIWLLLLGMLFYFISSPMGSILLCFSLASSFWFGRVCDKGRNASPASGARNKCLLILILFANIGILLLCKTFIKMPLIPERIRAGLGIFVPLGISFYTLTIIAYMVDVYRGKIRAERNFFRYMLFVSFFPQIIQGPIPRYDELRDQLMAEHRFDYKQMIYAFELIVWGLFQKMVIADNAAIIVNRVFGEYANYGGLYVVLAAFLYSIQLYTDFSGCVCIAKGSAELFGIRLSDNFRHPYFSHSVKEFWGRWHISLSRFLKDYIYIPLGGNRKGKGRKYINLLLTFLVSGIWHGSGLSFLFWGFLHGIYEIAEDALKPLGERIHAGLSIRTDVFSYRLFTQIRTFVLVAFAWIFFRADSLRVGLLMCRSIFSDFRLHVLFDESFYLLGLNGREFRMLFVSIAVLWLVGFLQERMQIRESLYRQNTLFRFCVLLGGMFAILVFGVYGPGYDAAQFIYGNF